VLVIADPQIVDHFSYGHTGLRLGLEEFFTDLYIRKAFRLLQLLRRPDIIVVLGDLMDGGRELAVDAAEWEIEYSRYRSIFANWYPDRSQMYEVVGNHDIGIGRSIVGEAASRLAERVGPFSRVVDTAGHKLVLLDTISLESPDPKLSAEPQRLLQSLRNETSPLVLFSHVPLWRPRDTSCGLNRQDGSTSIPHAAGRQYKTLLEPGTTYEILAALRPAIVFSGDDHNVCEYWHR
ncbi:hypothetical protein EV182_005719, partial [Spiromyces aspiralis]